MKVKNIEIDVTEENVLHTEIYYPQHSEIHTIEIGLCDVRAADEVRVRFSHARDGWVIYQPRDYHPHIEGNQYGLETEWFEVAFCPAWQYELSEEQKFTYKPGDVVEEKHAISFSNDGKEEERYALQEKIIELEGKIAGMKQYIRNGVELGYIDDREGDYKKYLGEEENENDGNH